VGGWVGACVRACVRASARVCVCVCLWVTHLCSIHLRTAVGEIPTNLLLALDSNPCEGKRSNPTQALYAAYCASMSTLSRTLGQEHMPTAVTLVFRSAYNFYRFPG
jgi:hypothetical protein